MSIQQNINQALSTAAIVGGISKDVQIKKEVQKQQERKIAEELEKQKVAQEIENIPLSAIEKQEAAKLGISQQELKEQKYANQPENLPEEIQKQRVEQAEQEYEIEQLLNAYKTHDANKDKVAKEAGSSSLMARKEIKNRFSKRLEAKKGGKR